MDKRPCQTKGTQNKNKIKSLTSPGACVLVEQLESPTLGYISQIKGGITKQRYCSATIFVDHTSRLRYVHLQKSLTSAENVESKKAFEDYTGKDVNVVRHYHAENDRFVNNTLLKAVAGAGQTISYCSFNAHFQNGVAEKRISNLQDQACKQLLNVKALWPPSSELNIWPYALIKSNQLKNILTDKEYGSSPLKRFSRMNVSPKLKDNNVFGCLVYALTNRLQAHGCQPKWLPRARLGINLGPSPRHSGYITLVSSLMTGLVSPKFHVRCDNLFENMRPYAGNGPTSYQWKVISGLKSRAI